MSRYIVSHEKPPKPTKIAQKRFQVIHKLGLYESNGGNLHNVTERRILTEVRNFDGELALLPEDTQILQNHPRNSLTRSHVADQPFTRSMAEQDTWPYAPVFRPALPS
jgi:hypothetical protein